MLLPKTSYTAEMSSYKNVTHLLPCSPPDLEAASWLCWATRRAMSSCSELKAGERHTLDLYPSLPQLKHIGLSKLDLREFCLPRLLSESILHLLQHGRDEHIYPTLMAVVVLAVDLKGRCICECIVQRFRKVNETILEETFVLLSI